MPSLTRRSALVGRSAAIDVKGVWIEERDLGKALVRCHRSRAAKAAATRVEFFTLVRGED